MPLVKDDKEMERRRILVNGIVQGVGFRPYIYNLACSENLLGQVSNSSAGVTIEIQGTAEQVESFLRRLPVEAPSLSQIVSTEVSDIPLAPDNQNTGNAPIFSIVLSENTPGTSTLIPPDMATCSDCLQEIFDPANRRHRYSFTNCTNCGPRWTIIERIPYDRPFTSMKNFTMCPLCQEEYENPANRRFHAQPNACPECGPRLWLEDLRGPLAKISDPVTETCKKILDGKIVAIKGLGGFHLAVRADREDVVLRLRSRKNREAKPLAVMVASVQDAKNIVGKITEKETKLLESTQAPIVLLPRPPMAKQNTDSIARAVAPGHSPLGVMLPYTPLHHLLMAELKAHNIYALVMTSGNASEEPICLGNEDARENLEGIADFWLFHNRPIVRRADDSVMQTGKSSQIFFRRSRGFAPVPLFLGNPLKEGPTVLATGPEMKNTITLLKDDRAFVSPHIGDLENLKSFEFFKETIATMQNVFEADIGVVAHDLHPGYFSTQWVKDQDFGDRKIIPIQHHHAHMAAVMAEHGIQGKTLGVIMDGNGFGTDGTIWGGEILAGDYSGFTREAHLETVPLPGGDSAIKAPWKTAASYMRIAFGNNVDHWPDLPVFEGRPLGLILGMMENNVNSPLTSSCGRLFDAVAALIGPWSEVKYEAQAAIELMASTNTDSVFSSEGLPGVIPEEALKNNVISTAAIIKGVVESLNYGCSVAEISAAFHHTLIDILVASVRSIGTSTRIEQVVLGGGVFQNTILLHGTARLLKEHGFDVFIPCALPPNDGAISFGQAAIARAHT